MVNQRMTWDAQRGRHGEKERSAVAYPRVKPRVDLEFLGGFASDRVSGMLIHLDTPAGTVAYPTVSIPGPRPDRTPLARQAAGCLLLACGSLPGHPRPCRPPAESSRVDRPTSDGVGWLQQGGPGAAVALITVAAFWRQVVWTTWY